jgi:hypothetical protein
LFTLHHLRDGRTAIVGSTCIEHYASVSPELVRRLMADAARLEAAAQAREELARSAAQSSEVMALLRQWSAAEYRTDGAIVAWYQAHPYARWLPPAVFRRPGAAERLDDRRDGAAHPFCVLPILTTTRGLANRLRKYLAACSAELAAIQDGTEAPSPAAFAR